MNLSIDDALEIIRTYAVKNGIDGDGIGEIFTCGIDTEFFRRCGGVRMRPSQTDTREWLSTSSEKVAQ